MSSWTDHPSGQPKGPPSNGRPFADDGENWRSDLSRFAPYLTTRIARVRGSWRRADHPAVPAPVRRPSRADDCNPTPVSSELDRDALNIAELADEWIRLTQRGWRQGT